MPTLYASGLFALHSKLSSSISIHNLSPFCYITHLSPDPLNTPHAIHLITHHFTIFRSCWIPTSYSSWARFLVLPLSLSLHTLLGLLFSRSAPSHPWLPTGYSPAPTAEHGFSSVSHLALANPHYFLCPYRNSPSTSKGFTAFITSAWPLTASPFELDSTPCTRYNLPAYFRFPLTFPCLSRLTTHPAYLTSTALL